MAETNGNGRLQQIARSEMAAGYQRIVVIVGTPLLIAAFVWAASTLVGLDGQFARIEGKIDKVAATVDGMERRVDRIETWRDSLPVRR